MSVLLRFPVRPREGVRRGRVLRFLVPWALVDTAPFGDPGTPE